MTNSLDDDDWLWDFFSDGYSDDWYIAPHFDSEDEEQWDSTEDGGSCWHDCAGKCEYAHCPQHDRFRPDVKKDGPIFNATSASFLRRMEKRYTPPVRAARVGPYRRIIRFFNAITGEMNENLNHRAENRIRHLADMRRLHNLGELAKSRDPFKSSHKAARRRRSRQGEAPDLDFEPDVSDSDDDDGIEPVKMAAPRLCLSDLLDSCSV